MKNSTHIIRFNTSYFVLFSVLLFLGFNRITLSQTADEKLQPAIDNTGRFQVEGSLLFGLGLSEIKVGESTEGDNINISGGGGFGGFLALNYGLTPDFDLSLSGGYQTSMLSQNVSNAEGSFDRVILQATFKYKLVMSETGAMKFGAGAGYYLPMDMDLDFSKISEGAHNVFSYDNQIGFHLNGEYVMMIDSDFSWGIGIKYTNVTYDLNALTSDGMSVPIDMIPEELKKDVMELDGSGVEFSLFISMFIS